MHGHGRPRTDETVVLSERTSPLAYIFWLTGPRRGDHVAIRPEGTTIGGGGRLEVDGDRGLATEQARIRFEGDAWYLYDLASSNQTKVAGDVVHRRALEDGDRVAVGEIEFSFRVLK